MSKLDDARKEIDVVDREIAKLFCRRMNAVKNVAEYKKEVGMNILDSSREEAVLKKNLSYIESEELKSYYTDFMRDTLSVSKNYQRRLLSGMRIAYSGIPGAFAHIAAKKIFSEGEMVSYPDFKSAYEAVLGGKCDCAVLPIENSYAGDVASVFDLAFFGSLHVNGIYELEITQNLLALPEADINDIKTVISHPQALGQCADYIRSHKLNQIEEVNTAVAAKRVIDLNDKSIAAIASSETARIYGLIELEKAINESSANTTRFAVFSKTPAECEKGQFMMFFTVKNEAGCLGKAVSIIGKAGVNLRTLKSRPTKNLIWNYYFIAEGEGNFKSDSWERMLSELKTVCTDVKIAGTYQSEAFLK